MSPQELFQNVQVLMQCSDLLYNSAPIANMLLGLLTELARNPVLLERLYEELRGVEDITNVKDLSKLPFLSSCLTEILRMYPALVTGGQRKTNKRGITVDGTYIPPQTTVVSPQWVIARSTLLPLHCPGLSFETRTPARHRSHL